MKIELNTIKIPVLDIHRSLPFYELLFGKKVSFCLEDPAWAEFYDDVSIVLHEATRVGGADKIGKFDYITLKADDEFEDRLEQIRQTLPDIRIEPSHFTYKNEETGIEEPLVSYNVYDPDGNKLFII